MRNPYVGVSLALALFACGDNLQGNRSPTASNSNVTTPEDTPVTFTVTSNDPDDDDLIFSFSEPAHGTITVDGGTVTYRPDDDYNGPDALHVVVSDGISEADADIAITVTPVNDAPVAVDNTLAANEDTAATVTGAALVANDTDVENDALTVTEVANPSLGTVALVADTVTFTPPANFTGTATFEYTVSDGAATDVGTVTVTVGGVNDPPVAVMDVLTTAEDTPATITAATLVANDTDVEMQTLSVTGVGGEMNGTANLAGGTVTFTPTADFNGAASFTYTVSDGAATATGTVNVTVTPVNDTPVANAGSATTNEDVPVTITLSGSDVEGSALTFAIAMQPATGTLGSITQLTATTASVTYTPNPGSNADDSFTFTVNDGTIDSAPATVTIDVIGINDVPVATPGMAMTNEDTPVTITLAGSDADGDALTFAIATGPSSGSLGTITQLTPTTASVTYTPNTNSNADDSFTFTVNDGQATSTAATVTIDVVPVDDPPVADPVATSTNEDTAVDITLSGSDVEGGALTFSIVMGPTSGSLGSITQLTPTTARVTYTPNSNSTADDSFTYRVTAGGVDSSPATVTIDVIPVSDPPIAVDDTDSTPQDQPLVRAGSVYTANDLDIDGPSLTVTAVGSPINGTVGLSNGTITFTPNNGYTGPASFDYTVSDGTSTDVGRVNITVFVNTAPVAVDDTDTTSEDTALVRPASTYTSNDIDPDPQTLTVTAVQNPANGTVDLTAGTITFTPTANFSGAASFEYVVSDGVATDVGQVNVTVTAVNDPPVANNDAFTVAEDSSAAPVDVTANDTNDDGAITVTAVTQPANGVVTLTLGVVSYQPNANFTGTDTFTYTITDSGNLTATATVTMTVTNVNDAPVANNTNATTMEAVPVTVNLSATDVDSASVTFAIASNPSNGTLGAITPTGAFTATVQYTPTGIFFGNDSFTFTASDGSLTSAPATAAITVNNVITCGDGLVEAPENCEDGDTVNGDGCSSTCIEETGWDCVGTPSVCNEVCGDGLVVGDEECDDMNGVDTDGCTTNCRAGAICSAATIAGGDAFVTDPATGHCYAAFNADPTTWPQAVTLCDAISADSHLVTITSSAEQALVHSIHTGIPWLGATDDNVDNDTVFSWVTGEAWGFTAFMAGEPDDDVGFGGNGECLAMIAANGGWGDTNCTISTFTTGRVCELEPLCGNGFVDSGEACDDGNNVNLDGCSAQCVVEPGAQCSGTMPTLCAKLVINEIDYDQASTDGTEFIEVYNAGTGPATLSTYALVLMNGSNNAEYFGFGSTTMRIQFSAAVNSGGMAQTTLAAGAYLVIASPSVTISATALRIVGGTTNIIQNGSPDAVGILNNTTMQLVDALSYEGNISAGAISGVAGTHDFREGGSGLSVAQVGAESDGSAPGALQRRPNGRDTNVTTADWYFRTSVTPGAANP